MLLVPVGRVNLDRPKVPVVTQVLRLSAVVTRTDCGYNPRHATTIDRRSHFSLPVRSAVCSHGPVLRLRFGPDQLEHAGTVRRGVRELLRLYRLRIDGGLDSWLPEDE